MDTRALRYFVAAYEEQSISGAAKRSYVAQPSVSTAIADLEAELGVPLFIRHPRGVTPTMEGQELYSAALQVLRGISAIARMFNEPRAPEPPLTLAVMPSIDVARLMQVLKFFTRRGDAAPLRLVELADRADARIVSDRSLRKGESFTPLWQDRYVLAMPAGHPLTLKKTVAIEDLQGVAFVERCSCEALGDVMAALERHSVQPCIVAQAKSEDWAAAMVASGIGCALLPHESAAQYKEVKTREIEGIKLERKVGIAHRKDKTPPRSLQKLLGTLQDGMLRWKMHEEV
jgi:DNA-binding transcriptional LysR family regulator